MNKMDKIDEALVQLNNRENYQPLKIPMVKDTQERVNKIISLLHWGKHIGAMTKKKEYGHVILTKFSPFDQANRLHPTIKCTAEESEKKITFLDTVVFKAERFKSKSILDIKSL